MKKLLNGRTRERGFSLVELLVVVAIFVALISLTVPDYMKSRPQRLLSGEANRLAATVRQGRLFSLRDNDKTYLEFIPEIDTYRLWSASGWRAYADLPPGLDGNTTRSPDLGDYDGDLDGDGDDYWDGGSPEDPHVLAYTDGSGYYYDVNYTDADVGPWDGTPLDVDVLLLSTYPGNEPIRTVSPKLVIQLDADNEIIDITRDLSDAGFVAGDNIVPLDVDLRMLYMADRWLGATDNPIGKRNGVLSHYPLLFIVFFPDGTLAASWDQETPDGPDEEKIDLAPGGLGAIQIHMQVRGNAFNPEAYTPLHPITIIDNLIGDEGPFEPICPFQTLSIEDANRESNGRKLTINNLSGRVTIGNYLPGDRDQDYSDNGDMYI